MLGSKEERAAWAFAGRRKEEEEISLGMSVRVCMCMCVQRVLVSCTCTGWRREGREEGVHRQEEERREGQVSVCVFVVCMCKA